MTLLLCLLLASLPVLKSETYCSFSNNQCVYNVQVRHNGECPIQESSAGTRAYGSSSECCPGVHVNVTLVNSKVAQMTRNLRDMTFHPAPTPSAGDASDTEQLLQTLYQTVRQLPSSEGHLAGIIRQAGEEIQRLQNDLTTCRLVTGKNCNGEKKTTRAASATTTPTRTPASSSATTTPIRTAAVSSATTMPIRTAATTSQGWYPPVDFTTTFCDFESSTNCGFTQTLNHSANWYRGQGRPRSLTGPYDDHTIGTPSGSYMFIDAYKSAIWFKRLTTAFLSSPPFDPAPNYCIRFWYSMHGKDVQALRVYAMVGTGLGYPVWSRSGQQSNDWILGEIDLGSEYTSRQFRIVFEATSESYYEHVFASHPRYHDDNGNIAVDDFYTYTTRCKNLKRCPPDAYIWKGANSTSCYTFHTSASNWRSSHVTCKKESATSHLVAVNSKDEHDFLVNVIKSDAGLKAAGDAGFYTSGNDEEQESDFKWTGQGNPYSMSYTNWYQGQPNNVGGNQDCVLLQYSDADYQWGDIECASSHPFICEVDLLVNQ